MNIASVIKHLKAMFSTNPFDSIDQRLTAIEALLQQLKFLQELHQQDAAQANAPLTISGIQLKEMTGWADGTFYLKVSQMPEGVVIRGKSKRLLFDREKLYAWLKSPANVI